MRKSLWSPDEDAKLKKYVTQHGYGNWSDVAKHAGLQRCGKSCRLRWLNYLRPDLKRGKFSAEEIRLIVKLHKTVGNSWSKIAACLPGRTDNDIKNFWHSYTRSTRRVITSNEHNMHQQSSNNNFVKKGEGSPSINHEFNSNNIEPSMISLSTYRNINACTDQYHYSYYMRSPACQTMQQPITSCSSTSGSSTASFHESLDQLPKVSHNYNPQYTSFINNTIGSGSSSIYSNYNMANYMAPHSNDMYSTAIAWDESTTDEGLHSVIWNFMNRQFMPTQEDFT